MKKKLKSQVAITIAFIVLVAVILISILSNLTINQKFKNYIAKQQQGKANEIAMNLSAQYDMSNNIWNLEMVHALGMGVLYDGYIIKVHNIDDKMVWDAEHHDMKLCEQTMKTISKRMQDKYPNSSGKFTSKEYPIIQGANQVGTVDISYYGPFFLEESDFQFIDMLNVIHLVVGGICFIGSIILGIILAKRLSYPIENVIHGTHRIANGDYSLRVSEKSNIKELDELILSVNGLAEKLERQDSLRKQLTADVSHELRTPLTTVSTHLEAMLEGIWTPTEERLQSVLDEIHRITGLIKDLENLAKVEEHFYQLNYTEISLGYIAERAINNYETDLYNKKINISLIDKSSIIIGDKERLEQVILNLLSNAIKYTQKNGNIKIEITNEDDAVVMKISDDGLGIPEEELPFIFERFYRADKSRNRRTGGAGIGLAVVKSIINAHNGTIEVNSKLNLGSEFIITLPYI